jgi:hypothetical protein
MRLTCLNLGRLEKQVIMDHRPPFRVFYGGSLVSLTDPPSRADLDGASDRPIEESFQLLMHT